MMNFSPRITICYFAIADIFFSFFDPLIELNVSLRLRVNIQAAGGKCCTKSPPPENTISSQGFVACFCTYCIHSSIHGGGGGTLPPVECFY